ncbi:MAG TPA: hypothetical protein VMN38_07435 [Sphingomicrobium sp.]|nr:hypothetical protein [Sphingomicrobium sp.]
MSKPVLTRFPFINLAKSLERARAIYDNDKGDKGLKVPVAFSAWGYSDKSSGGFQTIGALKLYGILVDEGANEDRAVRLSSDARQYFQTEIEEDKAKLRGKFAARPALMAHLLEHWDYGTVDDPVARTYLKTGIGLNEQSARSALGIYKDNLSFIRGKGSVKVTPGEPKPAHHVFDALFEQKFKVPLDQPVDIAVGDRVQWVSLGQDQFDVPRPVTAVFRDPEHGWFVSVRGEKGAIPMEQVELAESGVVQRQEPRNLESGAKVEQPIEVFLTSSGRLQITADIDQDGVATLIDILEKYKPILALVGKKTH